MKSRVDPLVEVTAKGDKIRTVMPMMRVNRYDRGCPCSDSCCNRPDTMGYEHECPDEGFCEDCYGTECHNCGAACWCDL